MFELDCVIDGDILGGGDNVDEGVSTAGILDDIVLDTVGDGAPERLAEILGEIDELGVGDITFNVVPK